MAKGKKNLPKNKKHSSKKKKKKFKILKWTSLLVLTAGAIALFLLSDIFNIKEIKVKNNNKISTREITQMSTLKVNENMFKFLKVSVEEKIKQNPYIESVKIKRKINRNYRNRSHRTCDYIYAFTGKSICLYK